MIAALCELYPVETTAYTAKVVGMSETAVKNKAKELGIVKIAKPLWMERAAHISSHFHTDSFSECLFSLRDVIMGDSYSFSLSIVDSFFFSCPGFRFSVSWMPVNSVLRIGASVSKMAA
jgi:hypothetical protein